MVGTWRVGSPFLPRLFGLFPKDTAQPHRAFRAAVHSWQREPARISDPSTSSTHPARPQISSTARDTNRKGRSAPKRLDETKGAFQHSMSLLGVDRVIRKEREKKLPMLVGEINALLRSYLSTDPSDLACSMTQKDMEFLTRRATSSPPSQGTLEAFHLLLRAHQKGKYPIPGQLIRSWVYHRLLNSKEPWVSTQVSALRQDEVAKDQVKMWRFVYDARREIDTEGCNPGSLVQMMEYMAYRSNFKALFLLLHSLTRTNWTEDANSRLATFLTGVRSEAMVVRWIQRTVALWEANLAPLSLSEDNRAAFKDLLNQEPNPLEQSFKWWDNLIREGKSIHPFEGRALARRFRQEGMIKKSTSILESSTYVPPSTTFLTEQRWTRDLEKAIQDRSLEQVEDLIQQAMSKDIFLYEHAFCALLRHLPSSSFDYIDHLLLYSRAPVKGVAIWDVRAHEYGLRGDGEGLRRVLRASLDGTFTPDARIYTTLIQAFSRLGMLAEIRHQMHFLD
ncbi:hypothetical protein BJ684DRAFT_15788 [Piptocephalis cylindrospora]|uniref:Uncharacterized protein n=1 Tax=Piptocephalis cylindrospora TaxID=1907219 RepID=A0A4P9Y4L5_9FUNG|nr:hypothetical protein BJ684DRAFT_15788 [Piptocephalis cylindrospora]|eukprot:RKP13855.1 hypothetical protein BJ684DRAFT_15788 [Piptocephalis cylindrospora]